MSLSTRTHRTLLLALPALAALAGLVAWAAPGPEAPAAPPAPGAAPRWGQVVVRPGRPAPRVDTGRRDAHGGAVLVSCGTCHATRAPDPTNDASADLDDFHQGLTFAHGGQTCLSCHDGRDYERLRLADGRALAFEDVITLCSQCHGPQRRDFDHGAHGGMMGYWDLSRGDRVRNACTACHDPHAPAYPRAMPVFPPKDAYEVRGRSHE